MIFCCLNIKCLIYITVIYRYISCLTFFEFPKSMALGLPLILENAWPLLLQICLSVHFLFLPLLMFPLCLYYTLWNWPTDLGCSVAVFFYSWYFSWVSFYWRLQVNQLLTWMYPIYWESHQSYFSCYSVFSICRISFWLLLRDSISSLTLPIYSCMLCAFPLRALNILSLIF